MKKTLVSRLNAYTVLQGVIESERTVLSALPLFEVREQAFSAALQSLTDVVNRYGSAHREELEQYRAERQKLLESLALLSMDMKSYAVHIQDNALRQDVTYTRSQLESMSKARLQMVAGVVVDRAEKALADASDVVGLTAAEIKQVSDCLASIGSLKNAQRNRQLMKRKETRTIESSFAAAHEAMQVLFVTLDLLSHYNPPLYQRLLDAKVTVVVRQSFSLMGQVAESKTEYPVSGVKLVIRRLGDEVPSNLMVTTPDLVKKTAPQGGFVVQSLPEGTYLLTASKLGYATTNVQFNVVPAETTRVTVLLTAV